MRMMREQLMYRIAQRALDIDGPAVAGDPQNTAALVHSSTGDVLLTLAQMSGNVKVDLVKNTYTLAWLTLEPVELLFGPEYGIRMLDGGMARGGLREFVEKEREDDNGPFYVGTAMFCRVCYHDDRSGSQEEAA
jgi:hypothetical protein